MLGRIRQTLFDILQGQVEGRVFADLYAGTGSVGIEALSRGAESAVFVESNAAAVRVIRRNLETLGVLGQSQVRLARVHRVLGGIQADIYFLGPPYAAEREYCRTLDLLSEMRARLVVAQHGRQLELARRHGCLERVRIVRIGRNRLSIFRAASLDESGRPDRAQRPPPMRDDATSSI